MFSKALVLSAVAAAVAADQMAHIDHGAIRRDLEARQTNSLSAEEACATVLLSIYQGAPSEPPAILSYFATATEGTDPCATPTYPASISSALTSYEGEIISWYSDHSAEISSALAQCPQLSTSLSNIGNTDTTIPGCTATGGSGSGSGTTVTGGGGAGTTSTSAAAGSSPTGGSQPTSSSATTSGSSPSSTSSSGSGSGQSSSSATSSTHTAAAARETGLVAGAIALVGFVGAVAAL